MRMFSAALAALLISGRAFATSPSVPAMPDSMLTPGKVATSDPHLLCGHDAHGLSYSRSHRVWHDRRSTLAKYDISAAEGHNYVDDDRVPVCLGGDNASPLNHWMQTRAEAERKDRLEDRICKMVCAGQISVTAAQAIFLGDWRSHL